MSLLDVATERDLERFMDLVDVLPCGCWFWTGARSRGKGNKKWYGTFWMSVAGRVRAHRFACEVVGKKGVLPRGMHRDHTCVFSLCVNPEHLEYVTHAENERRKRERLRCLTKPTAPFCTSSQVASGSTWDEECSKTTTSF